MNGTIKSLAQNVQNNCHIADALYAGNYTLCIYLIKMREFFRWENGQAFNSRIDKDTLGNWLTQREELWDSLEDTQFQPLIIDQREYQPMDNQGINKALLPHGLVYSSGYGNKAQPHFFLAELEKIHTEGGYTIYISHKELARDLTAPPAMAQGSEIYIRRESFRRMLWEKFEEWLWNKPDNAMKRAIQYYPFGNDINLALDLMTEKELNMALNHEIGEIKGSLLLGERWLEILAELPRSRGEIVLRSVKDHLADCLYTLPQLLETFYPESWHFYMANLSGMRKEIAPQLQYVYQNWIKNEDLQPLHDYVRIAQQHWLGLAGDIMKLRDEFANIKEYSEAVHQLVEKNYC